MADSQTSKQTSAEIPAKRTASVLRLCRWPSVLRHAPYIYLLLGSVFLIALHIIFPTMGNVLQWQPHLAHGQAWWRPFTAHLVHTNLAHLLINVLGLWLLTSAAYPLLRIRHAITLYLLCSVAIGLTLPISGFASYRGLSGVLYGVLAWLSVVSWRCPKLAILPYWFTGGLLLLLLWPDRQDDALTAQLIQAHVAHLAHLSGAVCGVLYGMLCRLPSEK